MQLFPNGFFTKAFSSSADINYRQLKMAMYFWVKGITEIWKGVHYENTK